MSQVIKILFVSLVINIGLTLCIVVPHRSILNLSVIETLNTFAQPSTYEIQNALLKILNSEDRWNIRTVRTNHKYDSEEIEFEAFSEGCSRTFSTCRKRPVESQKAHLYVIVVDDAEDFKQNYLPVLTTSSTYNPKASAMVFISKIPSNVDREVRNVIRKLNRGVVLIPKNSTNFLLFKSHFKHAQSVKCYSERTLTITLMKEFIKGKYHTKFRNIFREIAKEPYNNCTLWVQARKYPPYVIDKDNGIENELIKFCGAALNISFIIEFHPTVRNTLGSVLYDNRAYSGYLSKVYNYQDLSLAIGNLYPNLNYTKHFTYSVTYLPGRLTWAFPRASLIPSWRVLTVIFDIQMWGICLAIIFGFGILFYITSRFRKDPITFRTFQKCLTVSYEIIVAAAVPLQPISDYTRMIFISAAFLGIILNSVYTSSLIQYLTHPVREHQVNNAREWLSISGNILGGPKEFKTLPKKGSDLSEAFEDKYVTVDDEHLDWYTYWLAQVVKKRNIGTMVGRLPIRYLEAINDPLVTHHNGDTKIFMCPQDMLIRSISIMMKRGHPLKDALNDVLQRGAIEGGLIQGFVNKYIREGMVDQDRNVTDQDIDGDDNDEEESFNRPLTPKHLEGAFSILILGYTAGGLALVCEIIWYQIQKGIIRYQIKKGMLFEFTQ